VYIQPRTTGSNNGNIKNILQKSQEGNMIIRLYEQNNICNMSMRSKMVKLIIDHELKKSLNETLSSAQIQQLAKEIVECFETESEFIYYSPFQKINKNIKLARGKLWDRYCYVRKDIQKLQNSSKVKPNTLSETIEANEGSNFSFALFY